MQTKKTMGTEHSKDTANGPQLGKLAGASARCHANTCGSVLVGEIPR